MKKKLLLTLALLSMFVFAFALVSSAAAPEQYIEFGARFPGSDEYITVYTQNAESVGNPQINFANYKFYSDVEFTQEVDMSTVTGLDFSVAKTHGCNGNPPTRMPTPKSPFLNCVEVKWFLEGMPTVSYGGGFFKGWTGLKSFDFGNATGINDNTFEGCGFESITIPATITYIGSSAFKNCTSLKSVTFEGNIEKFNSNGATFLGCAALTDVKMDNLTTICKSMFESCKALTSATIPNSVTSIGNNAFYNCTSLASVSISNAVTSIGSNAFRSTAITSITIPSSVTTIDNEAFRQCGSLTSITIPSSVISVGASTFFGCTALTEVVFEGDNTQLGTSMFNACKNLASITLPKNLEKIPGSSFWGCGKLVIENISELTSLTTIGTSAFQDAETLVFTLPDTVTTIEREAFRSAFKKGGSFAINPTSQLQIIGNDAFNDCRTLPSIYIPSTVTSIGERAFLQTYALTQIENFENCQITELKADTFKSATKLVSIKLPKTLTTIEAAFSGNEKLALVYIPSTVTSIADTFTGSQSKNAVYVYTGKDAKALAACARLAGANVILASEYDEAGAYTGVNLVVGYSDCIAYNNGVHSDKETKTIVTSYYEPVKVASTCILCGMAEAESEIPAFFKCLGFSAPKYGKSSIVIGFEVNNQAIAKYEELEGKTIKYGLFAASQSKLGENEIFGENGEAIEGITVAPMSATKPAALELKVVGFTDETAEIKLAIGAYVAVTGEEGTVYSYLQSGTPDENEKYCFISYNDVVRKISTEEEVVQ